MEEEIRDWKSETRWKIEKTPKVLEKLKHCRMTNIRAQIQSLKVRQREYEYRKTESKTNSEKLKEALHK